MSFLSKLSQLKSVPTVSSESKPKQKVVNDEVSLLPKHYVRDEDPAVRRLKELRRKEILAREASNPSKKKRESRSSAAKTKSPSSHSRTKAKDELGSAVGTVYKRRIGSNSRRQKLDSTIKHAPIKIMSFEELMKQADSNAVEEKSVSRTSSPVNVAGTKLEKPGFKSKFNRSSSLNPQSTSTSTSRSRSPPAPSSSISPRNEEAKLKRVEEQHTPKSIQTGSRPARGKVGSDERGDRLVRVPIPKNIVSQPNKRLKEKLRKNRGSRESYDRYRDRYGREEEGDDYSDLDDFIEDDEGEWSGRGGNAGGRDDGYDKDEIWAMFNRGKRRSDYNYYDDYDEDDDDMEANEMEILEEEEESRKVARMEDKREEEWLKRHEMEKKRRKQRR